MQVYVCVWWRTYLLSVVCACCVSVTLPLTNKATSHQIKLSVWTMPRFFMVFSLFNTTMGFKYIIQSFNFKSHLSSSSLNQNICIFQGHNCKYCPAFLKLRWRSLTLNDYLKSGIHGHHQILCFARPYCSQSQSTLVSFAFKKSVFKWIWVINKHQ